MNIKEAPGIKPEIVAAICAAVEVVFADERAGTAAAKAHGARAALIIKRSDRAWVNYGRQKIMDSRRNGG